MLLAVLPVSACITFINQPGPLTLVEKWKSKYPLKILTLHGYDVYLCGLREMSSSTSQCICHFLKTTFSGGNDSFPSQNKKKTANNNKISR